MRPRRPVLSWTLISTVVVEAITLYLRFRSGITAVEFNRDGPTAVADPSHVLERAAAARRGRSLAVHPATERATGHGLRHGAQRSLAPLRRAALARRQHRLALALSIGFRRNTHGFRVQPAENLRRLGHSLTSLGNQCRLVAPPVQAGGPMWTSRSTTIPNPESHAHRQHRPRRGNGPELPGQSLPRTTGAFAETVYCFGRTKELQVEARPRLHDSHRGHQRREGAAGHRGPRGGSVSRASDHRAAGRRQDDAHRLSERPRARGHRLQAQHRRRQDLERAPADAAELGDLAGSAHAAPRRGCGGQEADHHVQRPVSHPHGRHRRRRRNLERAEAHRRLRRRRDDGDGDRPEIRPRALPGLLPR